MDGPRINKSDESATNGLKSRSENLNHSRRDFLKKGAIAGAAAAAMYVAPQFSTVTAKRAYAGITGGTTPTVTPTPTEEPEMPIVSGSPLMGTGQFQTLFNPSGAAGLTYFINPDSGEITGPTLTVPEAEAEAAASILTPNVAGVASNFVVKSNLAPGNNHTFSFEFRIDVTPTGFGCQLGNGGSPICDTGSDTLLLPAASEIAIKLVDNDSVESDTGTTYVLKFGWIWTPV